ERRHQRDLITQQHRHRHQITPHRHHRQPHTHHNSSSNSTVSLTTPPHFPKPPCCGVIRAYHTPKMVRNPLPRRIPPKTHTYRESFQATPAYHSPTPTGRCQTKAYLGDFWLEKNFSIGRAVVAPDRYVGFLRS